MAQMNHATTITLAQFTTKYRKAFGPINSVLMANDADYAWEIFRKVDADGDADLALLALNLKSQMGLFKTPDLPLEVATTDLAAPAEEMATKYKYGARS